MVFYERKRPLSPRQQKFVEQYLITGIGRQAAIRAGYAPGGAASMAWRLKRHPAVAEAIRLGRSGEARRAQVERDRVLLELVRVAFSDIGEVLDWTSGDDITLRPKDEISPHHRAAIAEIAPRRYGKGPRIKFHSKTHALDAIARHLGLFDKQPPTIDIQAQRRDGRDARTILVERLDRLAGYGDRQRAEAERATASLNAGAPLGIPSTLAPLAGKAQGEGLSATDDPAASVAPTASSVTPAKAGVQGPTDAMSALDSLARE